MGLDDDSDLLMAQKVPIPDDDSDSEDERSVNLISFAAPFEMFSPIEPGPKSQTLTLSQVSDSRPTASVSNALSSGSVSDLASSQQPVVEDALRARAEQAESAAERLLELVEPEDEGLNHHPTLPPSLLKTSGLAQTPQKVKVKLTPLPVMRNKMPPVTPNRASAIMRQAALFEDSPARNGRSTSLLDALQNQKQETGWGLKRKACKF
jgi:CLIP-associating protein 1/2